MELVEWDGEGGMGQGYIDREMVGDIDGNRWEYNVYIYIYTYTYIYIYIYIYTLNGND